MDQEDQRLKRAIDILRNMAEGLDPFTGKPSETNAFVHDPRLVRCLFYVAEVMEKVQSKGIGREGFNRDLPFIITAEEKSKIVLPQEPMGVNTFAKCVNEVLNPSVSKGLTGMALNAQLKKMGILFEESLPDGKHRTISNDVSAGYGIEMMESTYNGSAYQKVVFNEKGKQFLLDNLEEIMAK